VELFPQVGARRARSSARAPRHHGSEGMAASSRDCVGLRGRCLQFVAYLRLPGRLRLRVRVCGRVLSALAFRVCPARLQRRPAQYGRPLRCRQALWIERRTLVTTGVRPWYFETRLCRSPLVTKLRRAGVAHTSATPAEDEPRPAASSRDTPGCQSRSEKRRESGPKGTRTRGFRVTERLRGRPRLGARHRYESVTFCPQGSAPCRAPLAARGMSKTVVVVRPTDE
jgi:hypothetical protein